MLLHILFLIFVVLILNVVLSKIPRSPITRMLYLREITSPPSSMVTKKGDKHKNIFAAEFMLLVDFTGHMLDYAVMKHVGDAVPLLTKQEHKHALLHLAAIKQHKQDEEHAARWAWLLKVGDFVLRRSIPVLTVNIVTHFEAVSWTWGFLMVYLPLINKGLTNLYVFHVFEELEHAALTVQALKKKTNPLFLLFTLPFAIMFSVLFLFAPPIMVLALNPRVLLLPRTLLDLLKYYLVAIMAFVLTFYGHIVYCILPLRENQTWFNFMYQTLLTEIKARGISFKVVDQEEYIIY